jgi:hypothetical protein
MQAGDTPMREVSPAAKELARQLLGREDRDSPEAEDPAEAIGRAHRRLHQHLAPLIGPAGYSALFARALHLARAEFPALEYVALDEDAGTNPAGAVRFAAAGAGEFSEPAAALEAILAHFIWLLTTFIGEDLGLRLVREAWPELVDEQDGSPTRRHEHE